MQCTISVMLFRSLWSGLVLLKLDWLCGSSSTPQVLGSTPVGVNFRLRLKKIPLSVPHQSTGLRPSPGCGHSHMCYGAAVYGWGRVWGFSQPVWQGLFHLSADVSIIPVSIWKYLTWYLDIYFCGECDIWMLCRSL
jgi:hypothetical protein